MARISIPVSAIEFEEGGDTIWVQSALGCTTLRIKTFSPLKIIQRRCGDGTPTHGDAACSGPIVICLGTDADRA